MPDIAVVAGLNNYLEMENLQGAVHDANRFRDWLIAPDGGGLTEDNVFMIESPTDWDIEAPRPDQQEIEIALKRILQKAILGPRPIGSRLFLFLAGHGFNDPKEIDQVALYSSESEATMPSYVAARWYANEFRRIGAFEQIALIMDCCRRNSVLEEIARPQSLQLPTAPDVHKVKMFVAQATGFGSPSRESQVNGEFAGNFTRTFMDALSTARPNNQGRLTGSIIKTFVHNFMNPDQEADIHADTNKEFVFVEEHAPQTISVSFSINDNTAGTALRILNAGRDVVLEIQVNTRELTIELAPGIYKAELTNSTRNTLFEVPNNEPIQI